jgi:hypothetical protein|tara:strand:- start:8575 stop:9054 length:480 start_codon:yes stop_codon:yes gene_type:complete
MQTSMPRKQKEHYVDNKLFLQEITKYLKEVEDAARLDQPKPPIPRYIAECFMKIATHLSYRPNFINYMFKEDMVSDGIENCVQYISNFNPEKSKNPFAYFTQIIYYAFLRRIAKEKRQVDIRDKLIEKNGYDEVFHSDSNDDQSGMNAIKSRIETNMRY